jgi:hypothetical protein
VAEERQSSHPPHGAPEDSGPLADSALELDQELMALPAPPRGRRLLSIASLLAVIVAALALLVHLRRDVAYTFSSEKAVDLGEVNAIELSELTPNRYVRVRGTPMLSRMVRFERALSGQAYAVFPVAGQRQIFVQVPIEALSDPARLGKGEWSGRLATFGQLGTRFRSVRDYLQGSLELPVTGESFVVLAEEPPSAYGWSLALSALCLAIIALTLGLLWRWFKPLGAEAREPARAAAE